MRGRLVVGAVAVVLVAGIAAVAMSAGGRDDERVRATQITIKEAERELVRHRMRGGHYPHTVQPVPLDGWGRPLVIEVPGPEGQPYRLVSLGADGEPGGRGPNADLSNWEF